MIFYFRCLNILCSEITKGNLLMKSKKFRIFSIKIKYFGSGSNYLWFPINNTNQDLRERTPPDIC